MIKLKCTGNSNIARKKRSAGVQVNENKVALYNFKNNFNYSHYVTKKWKQALLLGAEERFSVYNPWKRGVDMLKVLEKNCLGLHYRARQGRTFRNTLLESPVRVSHFGNDLKVKRLHKVLERCKVWYRLGAPHTSDCEVEKAVELDRVGAALVFRVFCSAGYLVVRQKKR